MSSRGHAPFYLGLLWGDGLMAILILLLTVVPSLYTLLVWGSRLISPSYFLQGTGKWYELQDLQVTDILPQMITLSEAYIQVGWPQAWSVPNPWGR